MNRRALCLHRTVLFVCDIESDTGLLVLLQSGPLALGQMKKKKKQSTQYLDTLMEFISIPKFIPNLIVNLKSQTVH